MTNAQGNPKNGKPRDERGFTETQRKMLAVLSDGMPHRPRELHACLWDEMGHTNNIQNHLSNIRKILRPKGQDIVCEIGRGVTWYRLVRLIGNAYRG